MAIEFACGCGKKLKLNDVMAGKKVKCPACQSVLEVPSTVQMTGVEPNQSTGGPGKPPDKKAMTVLDEPGDGDLELDLDPSPAKPAAKKPEPAKPAKKEPAKEDGGYDLADDEEFDRPKSNDAKKAMTVLDGEDDFEGFELDVGAAPAPAKPAPKKPEPAKPAAPAEEPKPEPKAAMSVDVEDDDGGFKLKDDDLPPPPKPSAAESGGPSTTGPLGKGGPGKAGAGAKPPAGKGPAGKDPTGKGPGGKYPAGKDAPAPPPAKAPDLLEQIKKLPPVALYGGAGGVALLVLVIGVLAFSGGSKPPPPPPPPPAVAKGGTTDPGNNPTMPDNGGKPEEKKKAEVPAEPLDAETVKRLRAVSKEEAEALAACRDFWGRYETAVRTMAEDKSAGRTKAVAEFKSLADWCTARGLHEAARDAREFAGLLNPADEGLVRGSGRTETMVLPDKRTLYTTPAAKTRIAELAAELAVANHAYDELRVDVEGGAAGVVVVPRRERKTIPVRGGRVKFKLTAAGKTAAFEWTIPPGMGRQIKLIGPDRLPQLPFEAVRSAVALDAQVDAGNESPAMSRGLGQTRLLRSERLPTGGRKLVLSGPMPPTFFGGPNLPPDRPTPRDAQAVRVETIKLPDGAATKVTIGEREPVEFVIRRPAPTSLSDRITSGFVRERNLLVAAADREDARVRALPEDSVTTAIAVDRQGRMQSGAVVLLGFPADTQQVCQAMGFDVDEVMLAVERHLFAPLPAGAQPGGGDGGDLLAMVSYRPQLTWQLDSFLALCAFMGRNPDGAMYATSPLGTYEEVRWFRRQLAELFADRADPDLVAAMAPHTASVLTEVMDAATTQNFIGRPLAALLISWRGHDAAIPPLKKLAQEYLLFRDNPARIPDPYTRALVDRWVRTLPMPELITGALRNIGTDAAVAALIELINNQNADRETRRAAVLALAQSGRPAALTHMTGLVSGVDPALYAVVQRWIGRWDLPQTRHVVDEKLKAGADGLLFLAGAIAQQERGEGNLYILSKLVQVDPLSLRDQLSRAELVSGGRQGWQWKTVPLLTGAAPSEMVRSVCWLLGRRGDLISAGLMRDYLLREVVLPRRAGEPMLDESGEPLLDSEGKPKLHKDGDQVKMRLSRVLLESLPDAKERIPLLLYPSVPPGHLWSPTRHAKYGPALTLYEEAFGGFSDRDAAPLVSLLTEWILAQPVVSKGLRPWVLKLLAERRVAAARPLLTEMYRRNGTIRSDDTADDRCKLLAGLGLLRLADRESLQVVAGESLYENLLNPLRDSFIEQYDPGYATAPDKPRRADEFGGRLANPETGFRNSQGDSWETFVEENIWSHFRAQFASVRGDRWVFPQRLSDDPEEFLARMKRLQRDMRASANVQGPPPEDGDDAAPPPDRTVLKPGADPAVVGELLLEIVRPLDDSGLPQPVSSAFRSLRRRALSVLADLKRSDPKFTELLGEFLKGDAQKVDPHKIDLADLAIRRFQDPAAAKVRELLIEAAGRPLVGGHRRAENRVNPNVQGSLARKYGQQLDWMTASPERLDLPLACELAARENFDILAALRGDPVFTALLVLGEIGRREKGPDRPTVKVLAEIFDGKRPVENWSESFESVMDELLRRAAAAVALGIADPALAREKLSRVFTDAGWFGTDRLERLGAGVATPGQLEGARLVLVANFRRYCVAALGAVPGVADASCGPALATGAAYATLKPPFSDDPGINGSERAANQACLRLLLTVADKQVGSALTNMMFKVQADRLGLSPGNPMGKLVMQVVSTRCVSPAVGDRLLALLADPAADREFRRWAFNTMVFTGDANQLRELIRYARGRDFRTTFGQVVDPMRPMVLTACDPNGGLTNADAAAFLQRVLEAAADDNPGPEALMTPATIVRALRGLADNPDPAAVKALASLRQLPRYRHVAALLGFRRGDRSGVAFLAAGAAAAKPEDLRRSIAALRMMPDPATPGALLDLLEQSPEPDARRLAADALYSMLLAMTAPDATVALPEAETDKLDARVLKLLSARDTPSSLIMPLAYCTAMLSRDPGLTYLAGRAVTTPSVARGDQPEAAYDLHHMLACMDLIAERRRGRPGDGPAALVEGILVKRRQQKPMEDLLVAAAAELGVRCGVFAAKRETFEALLKKPGTRVSVLQALAVAGDTPEARAEGRKLLEALRDGSGMGPKAQKDETAELLNALARVEKLGGR